MAAKGVSFSPRVEDENHKFPHCTYAFLVSQFSAPVQPSDTLAYRPTGYSPINCIEVV